MTTTTAPSESTTTFKLVTPFHCRRVTFDTVPDIAAINEAVENMIPCPARAGSEAKQARPLFYLDSEGDYMSIATSKDLMEAVSDARKANVPTVKLQVGRRPGPSSSKWVCGVGRDGRRGHHRPAAHFYVQRVGAQPATRCGQSPAARCAHPATRCGQSPAARCAHPATRCGQSPAATRAHPAWLVRGAPVFAQSASRCPWGAMWRDWCAMKKALWERHHCNEPSPKSSSTPAPAAEDDHEAAPAAKDDHEVHEAAPAAKDDHEAPLPADPQEGGDSEVTRDASSAPVDHDAEVESAAAPPTSTTTQATDVPVKGAGDSEASQLGQPNVASGDDQNSDGAKSAASDEEQDAKSDETDGKVQLLVDMGFNISPAAAEFMITEMEGRLDLIVQALIANGPAAKGN